jgi:transposase-like protein
MRDANKLVAGIDYPRTLQEFDSFFPNEDACRKYLVQLRWPQGCQCPACDSSKSPWITARGYLHCKECRTETSITSGTIFEKTRYPLKTWFFAIWLITSQKYGASALGVKRALGLGSYQTAWSWLHKLRRAMVRPGRNLLHGSIEVDETYVGGTKKEGKRGRGAEGKEIVVIALEIHDPKGYGRVRMKRIPDVSANSLIQFICEVVKPGSEIRTDGWKGYSDLVKHGYAHKQTVLSDSGDPAHVAMPGVHRIAALLKRVLLSTHQGAVRGKHLDYYLDEYTFRFNRRTSRSRGLLFYRLMEQAVETETTTYRDIVDASGVE